ncbi:SMC family ATPase [Microbacterium oryzae]|uniref:Nuclease SbcCD subunit C n=1 Tax=Microbacterium oryzae TaxID=743009 RepID=A0A6I6DW89_9MICO|nr:SMC family ATPase [Microbacterium oryzae]QGU28406.1 SMC family ATPase [Microbacterium oryzae]
MRIHRVEIEGFGPFRERQVIDLDAYAVDGLFLIGGRTGAGKSSILDAITFAIFGSVPRYEGGEKRLRSDHCEPDDPTSVAVEFTTGGTRWRIERSPEYERPKKRGDGMTIAAARAQMGEVTSGAVEWKAAKDRDVANLVAEVVGLNQQQFLQVILLAQGRFARFLLADNNDRQKLLRTLFGSRRFEDYENELDQRRRAAEASVSEGRQLLSVVLDQADAIATGLPPREETDGSEMGSTDGPGAASEEARLTGLSRAEHRSRHEVEVAEAAEVAARRIRESAAAEYERLRGEREKQRQRDELRQKLEELDARAASVAVDRGELKAARRAESVRGALDAATRALASVTSAVATLEGARAAWEEIDASGASTPGELDALVEQAQQRIGAWQPMLEVEQRLPESETRLEHLRSEAEQVAARRRELEAELAGIPEQRKRLESDARSAAERAAGRPHAEERVTALTAQLEAAREVSRLVEEYERVARRAEEALQARDRADRELGELHRRRLDGYAAELASELVAGSPCAVCGSTAHPAPAERGDEHVTADEIDAADERKTAAARAEFKVSDERRDAQRALAEAEAKAGGRALADLEADRDTALAQQKDAESAAAELSDLEASQRALAAAEQRLGNERTAAEEESSELLAAIRSAENELQKSRASVAEARGDADSVAARLDVERRRAAAASGYAEAQREASRAERAAAAAAEALAEAVAEAGFVDVENARAAIRDAATQERLERAISTYDADLQSTKAALVELELLVLPDEEIDVDGARAALTQAEDERDAAVAHLSSMRQLAASLADALRRAEDAHGQIADAAREAAVIRDLADAVAGRNMKKMDLETFVLAAELEGIVEAANRRLDEMSDGRYALQHTDALAYRNAASGLGLEVLDRFTGQPRSPRSLSGGETFLASLALALGLAEVVTNRAGGITLDTLFIDEGFGSLDSETLETAMRTLDGLREGGRTVGVISHVEAMKEQIPAQLRVDRTPQGWSTVSQ